MRSLRATLHAALIAAMLALPAASATGAADETLDLRYALHLRGLYAGDMVLRYEQDGEGYRSELISRARGLADMFSRYRGTAVTEGHIAADDGLLIPVSYNAVTDRRNKTRTADVVFDPASGGVVEAALTKRGEPRDIDVPPELQVDVVDPLTGILSLRRQTAEALAGDGPERFGVSVFDGRRRYDVGAEVLGRGSSTLGGRERAVVHVRLTFRPLAGFDDDDLARVPGKDGYALAQLTDDERLVPLEVRTYGAPIATMVRLVEDCSGDDGCRPVLTN